jgi:hypothetical protein
MGEDESPERGEWVSEEKGISDSEFVRTTLVSKLPECAQLIEEMETVNIELAQDLGVTPSEISVYSLISEAFVWPVLVPALTCDEPAESLLESCFDLIEEFVTSSRYEVRQAAGIRIIEVLASSKVSWPKFSAYPGAVTREKVLSRRGADI